MPRTTPKTATNLRSSTRKALRRRAAARRGFTLLELTLVVVIITLLVAGSVLALGGVANRNRIRVTGSTLNTVRTAIDNYQIENGVYPESLNILTGPAGMLQRIPTDGWKQEIFYSPVPIDPNRPYQLLSAGPDRILGTEDDISVWELDNL
jgi:type II secretion system protein G